MTIKAKRPKPRARPAVLVAEGFHMEQDDAGKWGIRPDLNTEIDRLGEAAKSSGKALHGFADQAVRDLEVELSATPRWRWLKRRTLTRQLSKARYQYAVMGGAP